MPKIQGWIFVAGLVLFPAAIWLSTVDLVARFGDPASALRGMANLSALTGTAAFAVIMILGARTHLVERLIGGFDPMYAIHYRLGYIVPLFLACHALFVTSSRALTSMHDGLILLTPAAGWGVFLGVIAFTGLIIALLLPHLRQLKHETFVLVHRAVGAMFILGSLHVVLVPVTWTLPPILVAYLLALIVIGVSAFFYRSILGRFLVRRSRYRVTQVHKLGSTAVELVLSPLEKPLLFLPGQFVFVTMIDGSLPEEAHPISIASGSTESNMKLVVKALGDYTARLLDIRPGGIALLEGPYGGFSYTEAGNQKQIWIAGGIGVTPFLSMARSLGSEAYEIDFYYCTEQADEAFFLDELFSIGEKNPRFRVVPIRRSSLGHITADDIQGVSSDLVNKDIFISGPPIMIHNLKTQFVRRGVPSSRIHFEDFSVMSI